MSVENHYTKKLEQLKGPRATSDFILLAKGLFDAATQDIPSDFVIPTPTHFSDDPEATRVYWKVGDQEHNHDFFQVHLIGRSILFTLQHSHLEPVEEPEESEETSSNYETSGSTFVDTRNVSLVVGSQPSRLFAHDGVSARGSRDAIRGRETDTPWFHESGRDILLPAFRRRLDHTMAAIGIHEAIPETLELPQLQELLLAS